MTKEQWIAMGIGMIAGLLSGLAGIGGGIVMVPLMVYLLGYPQHVAQGTSLAVLSFPVLALSAYMYWRAGNLQLKIAPFIALGLVIGSVLVAYWVQRWDTRLLQRIFGGLITLIGLYFVFKK
ncbi:MAG: sulfite exporter TauE/SafE family protein [Bacteroidia bacterium]